MADLFGDWVPSSWIGEILQVADINRQHIFQFLTKNPKRLSQWNGYWSENCWVGTTVTNQADINRIAWLSKVDAKVRFVSHEPLTSGIDFRGHNMEVASFFTPLIKFVDWAIIGAMTGPGAVKVEPAWVIRLEAAYQEAGVPVFEKNNLQNLCGPGAKLIQEWPAWKPGWRNPGSQV